MVGRSGGQSAGCAYPAFPPSQSLSNNREKMTRHLGCPLLSFGRERPERVLTFPWTTTELKEKCTFTSVRYHFLLRCPLEIGCKPFSTNFSRLHPSFNFFALLFSSIVYRLSSREDGEILGFSILPSTPKGTRKVPGRYPGAGSLPGGHYVVVMPGISPL